MSSHAPNPQNQPVSGSEVVLNLGQQWDSLTPKVWRKKRRLAKLARKFIQCYLDICQRAPDPYQTKDHLYIFLNFIWIQVQAHFQIGHLLTYFTWIHFPLLGYNSLYLYTLPFPSVNFPLPRYTFLYLGTLSFTWVHFPLPLYTSVPGYTSLFLGTLPFSWVSFP